MTLIETIDDISELAFGYMASKALFAGLELELFTHIATGATTLDALVDVTGVPENRMLTLLTALVATGFLTQEGADYANGPASERFLVSSSRHFYGDYLRMQINRQMYPFMSHLEAVMQGKIEQAPFDSYSSWMADPGEAETYSRSQHTGSVGAAVVLSKTVDLSAARTFLDVGGGSGAFAITLCQRHPNLSAIVIDFPNVTEVGKQYVEEADLSSRVTFQPGNALTSDWPMAQDVLLMSYLLSSIPGATIADLFKRVYETLTPGGMFLVHDFILDDDRSGPRMTALWALQHVVFTPGGFSLTQKFLQDMLTDIGFEDIVVTDLLPGLTRLIQARRPA